MTLNRIEPLRLEPFKPLLSYLKKPLPGAKLAAPPPPSLYLWPRPSAQYFFEGQIYRIYRTTIITLIEKGISLQLSRKFKEIEKLEEFVIRAAIIIHGTMDKPEAKHHHEENITQTFDEIKEKLGSMVYRYWPAPPVYIQVGRIGLDNVSIVPPDSLKELKKIKKASIGYKELGKVEKVLDKFKERFLRQIKVRKRPDVMDGLIRLFEEFLPKETETSETFIDKQIITMLKPFGYDFKPGAVKMRKYRTPKEAGKED